MARRFQRAQAFLDTLDGFRFACVIGHFRAFFEMQGIIIALINDPQLCKFTQNLRGTQTVKPSNRQTVLNWLMKPLESAFETARARIIRLTKALYSLESALSASRNRLKSALSASQKRFIRLMRRIVHGKSRFSALCKRIVHKAFLTTLVLVFLATVFVFVCLAAIFFISPHM